MKKASAVLYLIGSIFAAISFVALLVVGILGLADVIKELPTVEPDNFRATCVAFIISATFSAIGACLGYHGYKLSIKGSPKTGFHVFMLVISILSWDILLLLASVFGLVAAEQPRK